VPHHRIPKPKNWQDFERAMWVLARSEWNDPNAQRHGRQGQSQHGVDIFGQRNGNGTWIGIQCKSLFR